MTPELPDDLPDRLLERLRQPLAGRRGQAAFAPALAYGRHYGPPAHDARRAAVAMLLYQKESHWHLPLTLRPEDIPAHAGQISLPGGVTEADETDEQAALRELEEELGVVADSVRVLGRLSPLYVFASNFWVTPFVVTTAACPDFRPNPTEVAELIELPLAALLDETNYGQHQIQRRGVTFTAPHIAWQRHQIWGATSMMLGELIAVLRELVETFP